MRHLILSTFRNIVWTLGNHVRDFGWWLNNLGYKIDDRILLHDGRIHRFPNGQRDIV